MAKVRDKGNTSTEMAVQAVLKAHRIVGWRKHPRGIPGCPDFYFPGAKLAVFVDGCFWHACPKCGRIPKTRVAFWSRKIDSNRRRDARTRRLLRSRGYATIRIWEHEARIGSWPLRLMRRISAQHDKLRLRLGQRKA